MANQAERVIDMTPRLLVALMQSAKELTDMIIKILEENKEYQSARQMAKYLKDENNNIDFQICKGFSVEAFGKKLNEYNIPHVFFQDTKTGLTVCVTRDKDRDLVRDARNEFFKEQRCQSKVTYADFNNLNAGTQVMHFENLTAVQDKKFAEYAKAHNFITSSVKEENGTYSVYFSVKDYAKAEEAFKKTIIDTIGVRGKATNEHYTNEINNIKNIYDVISNPNNNGYIVSTANPKEFIHFNGNELEHTRGQKTVSISKTDERFAQDAFNHAMEIVEPMYVSKENYDTITKLIDQYSIENNLQTNRTASTVWTFINHQYDGNVEKFLNDLDSDVTRLTIEENSKGQSYLKIKSDIEKPFFTKDEIKKVALENKVKNLLLKNENIEINDIIKELNITDKIEQQYVMNYLNKYHETLDNSEPIVSFVDKEQILEDFNKDESYYSFESEFDK